MPPPEVWGPATWTLFHVLAEKVNENVYPRIAGQIFDIIKRICSALPCPECAQDATIFLGKVRLHELRTKNDFKNMIYMFHNYVNSKKRKPLFNYYNLEIYKKYNIVSVFNRFISVYHTKGNMRLLSESFQRQLIVRSVREWFSRNVCFFISREQPAQSTGEVGVASETIVAVEETVVEEPNTNCCIQEPLTEVKVEESTIEDVPVISEPVIEEPVVEEPLNEVIITEEQIVIEEPLTEVIIREEQVVVEEPLNEVKVVEEPLIEEPLIEEPLNEVKVIEEPLIEEQIVEEEAVVEEEQVVSEEQVVEVKEEPVKPKRGRPKKSV